MATKATSKFAKPAWLQKKEATQSPAIAVLENVSTRPDAIDIFKRGADTQAIVAAEQERKERRLRERKEKEAHNRRQNEQKAKQQALEQAPIDDSLSTESRCKRRRISTEDEDSSLLDSFTKSRTSTPLASVGETDGMESHAHVIVGDSEDEGCRLESKAAFIVARDRGTKFKQASPPQQSVIVLSDDEEGPSTIRHSNHTASTTTNAEILSEEEDEGPNPIMTLFIEPRLPNTNPLLVRRRYNQKLKDVRLAWCKHNELSPGQTAEVIFIWNDKRLFDVQSCKGMGIKVDEEGQPYVLTEDDIRAPLENVALIATTRQILEQEKRAEKTRNEIIPDEPDEVLQPSAPTEKQYKVILRSKSYPDHKLLFKDDTTIQKAAFVFKRQHSIPEDQDVVIIYDGEPLSPESRIQDTDIAEDYDGDAVCLEVHIK